MTHTAICIASGPSLTTDDVEYCRGKGRIYAVKEAALLATWADILYAADYDWWVNHQDRWQSFAGEKWTVSEEAAERYGLKHIKAKSEKKWSVTPGEIATGGNSGFQVINMAALDGAEQIILLGFDYGYDERTQTKHWWDGVHPRNTRYSNYIEWNRRLNEAAPLIQIPVLNASRRSNITCFPAVNLRDVI